MKTRTMFASLMRLACPVSSTHAQQANPEGGAKALRQASTENGITCVCAGVGSDEAGMMKHAARGFERTRWTLR